MKPVTVDQLDPAFVALNADRLGLVPPAVIAAAQGKAKRHPLEKQLQRDCENELCRRGIVYFHIPPTVRLKVGWPDLVMVVAGVPWGIELKQECGKVTPEQEAMLAAMKMNGWHTAVVRSYEDFRRIVFPVGAIDSE